MNGLLVRVGIDSACGGWNAPVRDDHRFAYVPIPEGRVCHPHLERRLEECRKSVRNCGAELPGRLSENLAHLDPDFEFLTFGDQGQRGRRIVELQPDDLLVFYAGLRSVSDNRLRYALIGLYVVAEVVSAASIPVDRWHENAHTRRLNPEDDVVVRARPDVSGRLKACIPIGEYREGAYRVTEDLLDLWGGLDIRNGYIHRSVQLPRFQDAARFYAWFQAQKPQLIRANNTLE